jgi:hypothetical protein
VPKLFAQPKISIAPIPRSAFVIVSIAPTFLKLEVPVTEKDVINEKDPDDELFKV